MRKHNGLRSLMVVVTTLALGVALGLQMVNAQGAWTPMPDAHDKVHWGGALAYDGSRYIYALRGKDTQEFWRFDTSTLTWDSRYTLQQTPDKVKEGGALVYVAHATGNFVYAFQGKDKTAFWRYSISLNSWTSLLPAPGTVKEGGALAWDGGNYIYALRGDDTTAFWRYRISLDGDGPGNTWQILTVAPEKVKEGGALAYAGDFIYALRGDGSTDFWRYSVSGGWAAIQPAPANVKAGGALAYDGSNYIYAFRGDDKKDFWRYRISDDAEGLGNTWETLTVAPDKVKYGGALVRAGDYIYAFRGNDQKSFWRYSATEEPPCRECKGGVTQLTLRYNGTTTANIEVYEGSDPTKPEKQLFSDTVAAGGEFTFTGIRSDNTMGTEISVWVGGVLNTTIHTSCSQDIGPGLVRGDFEVVEGYSKDNGKLCPLPDCQECKGGVTQLTLKYLGASPVTVRVEGTDVGTVFGPETVNPGQKFSFGQPGVKLGTETKIYVGSPEALHTTIHTSCSQHIGPGMAYGDFEVVEGYSKDNGKLCPICGECVGGVTELTLKYLGASAVTVRVEGKDVGTVFGPATVNPGEEFPFGQSGVKLGTETYIYVGGVLHDTIHTSCSRDIYPGMTTETGDFEVVDGSSKDGGPFVCKVDLALTKTLDTQEPYSLDQLVTFSITVTNEGYVDATGVQVEDFGWSNLQYDSADSGGVYNAGPPNVIWDVGDLPAGDSVTVHITFTTTGSAPLSFVNDAEIYACDQQDMDSTPDNGWTVPPEDDIDTDGGSVSPTAVTLSSFAAKSSAGGPVSPLWPGLAGLTVLVAGSLFWAKRRAG